MDLLDPDIRITFREHSYGALGTIPDLLTVLEEAKIYWLLEHELYPEVAARATEALTKAVTPHERRIFQFALAKTKGWNCLIWSGANSPVPALRELAAETGPFRTPSEYLLQGRILVALAEVLAKENKPQEVDLSEAWECVSRARELIPLECHLERGEMALVEALLEETESRSCQCQDANAEIVSRHRDNAELAILRAFNEWRLARRWDLFRKGIHALRCLRNGLKLRTIDTMHSHLLIPWLYALVCYEDLIFCNGHESEFHTHGLHNDILEAFNALPLDISPEQLPISIHECYKLVKRSIVELRNEEFFNSRHSDPDLIEAEGQVLAVESAVWFRRLEEKEKEGRGY